MFLEEMTPHMREMLEIFNAQLEQAGWEVGDYDALFHSGMSVSPEGTATMRHDDVVLEANLSLAEPELQLYILDQERDHLVRLALECGRLDGILRTLTARQNDLDTGNFPQFLLKSAAYADRVWFIDHEGRRFLLDMSDEARDEVDEV